jgi:amino acid adenylation domain-containing protein
MHQPDQPAYTFLSDGDAAAVRLSYAELDRQARAIAAELQHQAAPGARALLLYPPGLDFVAAFFGCLYAGMIAVPAYPPHAARLERTLPRIRSIVGNAQPQIALTVAPILARVEPLLAHDSDFHGLRWLASDTISADAAGRWQPPTLQADTLAFLQYTSGSTAAPKGVMVSHGNLLHNERLIQQGFGHDEHTIVVGWLPLYHDMGLIGNVLQPLYIGRPCVLMSPVAFLQSPVRWLQAISQFRATTSGGPNFAYDLCSRKITPEQRATLDLSSWRVAFNGAEPIRHETLERFATTFAECGFRREALYPCYGLAEATLFVTGSRALQPFVSTTIDTAALERDRIVTVEPGASAQTLVSSGKIWGDQTLAIVDPATGLRCATDQVGEIWVAGPSVAQGYWKQPEESERSFRARLADTESGPFLRTGDLGFVQHGELFVTGRLKDLIIIRGRNHYPQDIERTAERSHPALRPGCSAAFSLNSDGEERLVIVQEVEREHRHTPIGELAAAIRKSVAEQHELQVYAVALLKPGGVPKTSSGKIQRSACRVAYLAGTLDLLGSHVLEQTAVEQSVVTLTREALLATDPGEREALLQSYLRSQVAQVLGVDARRVELDQPASTLGIDSLMAVELQHAIETALEVVVPMVAFLEERSLAELAADLLAQAQQPAQTLARSSRADDDSPQPLSHGQRALWFLHQLAPGSSAYHIASAVLIRSEVDLAALERALQTLVDRHPALRASFGAQQGEPFQRIHRQIPASFQAEDASTWNWAELNDRLSQAAQQPFDLKHPPLLRVNVFARSAQEHVLLLVMHHLVADLWSLAVLVHELGLLYPTLHAGQTIDLPELTLGPADYARWQHDLLASAAGERLARYWSEQLAGAQAVLNLPTDRPRPPLQTYRGLAHSFAIEAALAQRLKALAQAHGTTLFTTLLAAFQVLLFRYTGQHDLLVGSPTTGRSRADFANLVGYLVNPVVLRGRLAEAPSFAALLAQMRQTVLHAFAHQEYPFPLLVEQLQPERDPSRSPLFQVMFVLQQAQRHTDTDVTAFALGDSGAQLHLGGLRLESLALEQPAAQFDLTLMLAETARGLAGSWQYNADLFEPATIARMAGHFQTLLHAIADHPEARIADLPLLTESERRLMLHDWNANALPYRREQCIHSLFEMQARYTPDATALIVGAERLSYAELDRRASALAQVLRAQGAGPEVPVAVCSDRSAALIVALLAILKAGSYYVPLDPAYPAERLQFMLDDTEAPLLLTTRALLPLLPETRARRICLDEPLPAIETPVKAAAVTANNLAYIIYTSGSTGRPKGVAIAQRSAVAMLDWAATIFSADVLAGTLAATSICFDLSVFEIFLPLSCGGTVILADHALALPALPAAGEVTLINTVPSAMTELLRSGAVPPSVRTVNLAGEPLKNVLAQQIYRLPSIERVFNLYGPSEDTTYSTFALIERGSSAEPTIGRPIANTQAYILDQWMQPLPIGVPGEIYLGGDGLSRGYLKRPEQTAAKYLPDPFSVQPGGRLYRTGDLGRFLPDGTIEYLGRIDHQVKLRGFRIELGEIEARLLSHPAIREAVVLAREDAPGDTRLVAYVVEEEPANKGTNEQRNRGPSGRTTEHGEDGDRRTENGERRTENGERRAEDRESRAAELRAYLQARLPEYMLPSAFVVLDTLPKTPNGKIDRKALPAPDLSRPALNGAFVAPRTSEEAAIAAIWREVLGVERIGVHDNFFELGGHSLKATQVMARVQDLFGIELPLHTLFEEPTVARLAQVAEHAQSPMYEPANDKIESIPRGDDSLEQLLADFERMSDEDLLAMLETADQPKNTEL